MPAVTKGEVGPVFAAGAIELPVAFTNIVSFAHRLPAKVQGQQLDMALKKVS